MKTFVFQCLALLPLRFIHFIGTALGWLAYYSGKRYAALTRENLFTSALFSSKKEYNQLLNQVVKETGKSVLELPVVWFRPRQKLLDLVVKVSGWEWIEQAQTRGKGIIFLTPHLGCFELASFYYADKHPLTVLYRPPKLKWLGPLMERGRQRGQVSLATTDLKGVRRLLAALKRGEAIGMLPDQVPGQGEGIWAQFFGRPAYTMTLAARLYQSTGATMLLVYSERLPHGQGYVLHIEPLSAELPETLPEAIQALNWEIESLVRRYPSQYLWSYNRYKIPRGATPPPTMTPAATK